MEGHKERQRTKGVVRINFLANIQESNKIYISKCHYLRVTVFSPQERKQKEKKKKGIKICSKAFPIKRYANM